MAARREKHVASVSGRRLRLGGPLVDYQPSIDHEHDFAVCGDGEAVAARRKVDHPCPSRQEVVRAHAAGCAGAAIAEVEIEEADAVIPQHQQLGPGIIVDGGAVILSYPMVNGENALIAVVIQSLPGELGRGGAAGIIVLQLDLMAARREKYIGCVSGRRLRAPLVDY